MDAARGLRHLRSGIACATVSSRCCSVRPGVWWISTQMSSCAAGAGRLWTGAAAQTDSGPDRFVTCSRRRTGETTRTTR